MIVDMKKILSLLLIMLLSGCASNFNRRIVTETTVIKYYCTTECMMDYCERVCLIYPLANLEEKKIKMRAVFKSYEKICNVKFEEVNYSILADIVIGQHEFTKKSDSIAHASPGFIYIFPFFKNHFIHMGSNHVYDFSIVFQHELGHVLGLNHSANYNSPMYPNTAYTRREFDSWDIYILVKIYGPPNL